MRITLIFIYFDTGTGLKVFKFNRGKLSVFRKGHNIIVEVSACRIRVSIRFDPFDQFYHIGYVIGSLAHDIGTLNVKPFGILKERLSIEIGNFQHALSTLLRCLYHLIFTVIGIARKMPYIGYIHYMGYRISQKMQQTRQRILKYIGS